MWATYNYAYSPLICVEFNNGIQNNDDFNDFIRNWTLLYKGQTDFYFLFDTTNTSMVGIKYAIKMSRFIKKLKEFPYQYLQQSVIIVKDKYIKFLLNIVFMIQKPVAPVYMINYKDNKEVCELLKRAKNKEELNQIVSYNRSMFSLVLPSSYTQ